MVVTALLAAVMARYGLAGRSRLSGPILFDITPTHGVHREDLVVMGCWAVLIGFCVWDWVRAGVPQSMKPTD